MASEFAEDYLTICRQKCIEPHDSLLQCLKRPCASPGLTGKGMLNLRTTALDEQTCAILGKLLSLDRLFEHIDLADCALSDAAVNNLICGLNTNMTCKKLNLKGNNIRGKAVESLGRLLRQNQTLECMILEWNNVGMLDEAFMVFCEGVGSSTSLVDLDLRNNQISHHGAAELSTALKRNSTLRRLDLRWNGIGLVGGKALLELFKFNRTLSHIELSGNDIPEDLRKSIENSARSNEEIHNMSKEYQSRTHKLASELTRNKKDTAIQLDHLMNKLDDKEEKLRKSNKFASQKVEHFKELLEERKSAFHNLTSRLARVESEQLLAEQRTKDLEILLDKERTDKDSVSASYRHELRTTQDQHNLVESRLTTQVDLLTEKNDEATIQLEEMKKQSESQMKEIHHLKQTIAELQADGRVAAASSQELLKKEQHKHSQTIRELTQQKDKEIEQVRQDQSVVEKSLREHISRIEQQRRDADEEISKLKATIVGDKMRAEEELSETRKKLKADQDFHMQHVEDKVRLLSSAKDEVQQLNSQQSCVISELQTKNSSLSMTVDNLKRQIEGMQQNLATKHQDVESAKQHVQLQMTERVKEAENETLRIKNQREKQAKHEKRLEEQVTQLETSLEKKMEELKHVKEKLAMRETEIGWMREETAQRAQALQNAVRNYTAPLSAST